MDMKRIIRMPVVKAKTGLGHTEIYERIKKLTFPRQVRLGPKCVGWLEEEIDAWIDQRAAERGTRVARVRPAASPPAGIDDDIRSN
jgi:prophage regulatory protein